ncbi:MAG TPA: tetratricopeptide repeat protein [Steroidobacteraceae bacterium]|jgi:tetratricopeptide (TPR) repeat protein|nr:tetratricopeptide repeat protein [Steroidobacteraceae bacterium]
MNTNKPAWLRAALLALTLPLAALAAVQEIPVTTSSAEAKLAFDAGQAALDRGDAAEANELFRTAVGVDPSFTYAWVNLSNVAFSTEEFNAALRGGEQGAARSSDGEHKLLEFNKLFLTNNFDAQLTLAKQLTDKYPNSPRAWMLLAGAQAALNKFDDQRATLAKLIELAPWFSPAPFTLGASYLFNEPRDFEKAEKYYRQAISAAPGNDMYYWSLGDVYRGSNKLEDARRYYKLALQLDPKDPTAPLKLGHVDSFLGNFDEARKDYDRGIEAGGAANAGFLVPFKSLTWVYAGEPAKAIQSLEKLVADIDGFGAGKDQVLNAKIGALTTAAQIAFHQGLNEDAERILAMRTALMRENAKVVGTPEFANILETQIAFFDGQLAACKGDYKTATKLAQKTAELVAGENNPRKMEPYHELLGLIALRQKSYKKAVTELRLADQTQLHNKYLLAQALEGAGSKDEALKLYKEVSVNNFNTVDFALLRAEALKKTG